MKWETLRDPGYTNELYSPSCVQNGGDYSNEKSVSFVMRQMSHITHAIMCYKSDSCLNRKGVNIMDIGILKRKQPTTMSHLKHEISTSQRKRSCSSMFFLHTSTRHRQRQATVHLTSLQEDIENLEKYAVRMSEEEKNECIRK